MDAAAWKDVLETEALISEADSEQYSHIFEQAKMTRQSLRMLDRQTLTELGVASVGNALAILSISQPQPIVAAHQLPPAHRTVKLPTVTPPRVHSDMTHPQWRKFLVDWQVFQSVTKFPNAETHIQLYSCCADDVQTALINMQEDYFDLPIDLLLGHVERIVTQKSNPSVYRMSFTNITQDDNEAVRTYVVRLRSSAKDCEFACPNCTHDLSEVYIKDQFIRGINNDVLQTDILAKAGTLKTLAQTVQHAESFETALHDQSQLSGQSSSSPAVQAVRMSNYRRTKQQTQHKQQTHHWSSSSPSQQAAPTAGYNSSHHTPAPASGPRPCTGCGSTQHSSKDRSSRCPAWGKACLKCSRQNHFSHVCRSGTYTAQEIDDPGAIASLMAHIHDPNAELCGHVCFNQGDGTFSRPSGHAVQEIDATLIPFSPTPDPRPQNQQPRDTAPTILKVFPDSGASICLAGPQHLTAMGLNSTHLIPCNKTVRAVGGFTMTCHGWLPIIFAISGRVTKQALYICEKVDKIYFSRRGCIDIGIIPESFPTPMPHADSPMASLLPANMAQVPHPPGLAIPTHGTPMSSRVPDRVHVGMVSTRHVHSDTTHVPSDTTHALSAAQHVPSDTTHALSAAQHVPSDTTHVPSNTSHVTSDNSPSDRTPPSRPAQIPFPPTQENVPRLEKWLLDAFRSSAFNRAPPFPSMTGPPAHIHLTEGAIPKARHTPIPVPYHFKAAVKAALDADVEKGIISPVPVGHPTDWCAVMVITQKKDGSPRRTVDYQYLNGYCKRETHHTLSPFHAACLVPPHTKKTVLDAVDGYHAISLDEQSRPLTTFITEWGRYWYNRMPQGFIASGDAYTRRFDEVTKDVLRKVKIVDDSLLYDDDIESAFFHTFDYLYLGAINGVVYSDTKFQFCRDNVDFAGLQVTTTGVAPSSDMLQAIYDFPTPKSITDARSWFGLVNQIAWAYSLGPVMLPFRDLLKPDSPFYWDDQLSSAFQSSKAQIISLVKDGLAAFDMTRRTCLAPDWSKHGMGFLLLQQYCDCDTKTAPVCCPEGWRLVFAGSRFCTPAESRYAPIEGEAAAIAWGLEKCGMFVAGCDNLIVATDHQPLLGILGDRNLADIANPRLFKIKQRTLRYRFSIQHTPGRWQRGADAMSRNPVSDSAAAIMHEVIKVVRAAPSSTDVTDSAAIQAEVHMAASEAVYMLQDDTESLSLTGIRNVGQQDPTYIRLIETILRGFPDSRHQTDPSIREYYEVKDRLSVEDGVVLMDSRIVIPRALRKKVLQCFHAAHQGVTGMQARANLTVYWPGMTSSIKSHRETCLECRTISPSNPREPLIPTALPQWPFQAICMDFFVVGPHTYLACADRYSGWLIVYHIKPGGSKRHQLLTLCRELFATYGAPDEISTDGDPIFMSGDFQQFLTTWFIRHRLSSAHYPTSNGRAELAVKSAKRLIMGNTSPNGSLDNDKVTRAILQYRNTPLEDCGLSPAQLLLHRQLKDGVPSVPSLYKPDPQWIQAAQRREFDAAMKQAQTAARYNTHTRDLPHIPPGANVVLQNQRGPRARRWDKTGRVIEALDNRQYRIRLDGSGRISLRNRRFMRLISPQAPQALPQPLPAAPEPQLAAPHPRPAAPEPPAAVPEPPPVVLQPPPVVLQPPPAAIRPPYVARAGPQHPIHALPPHPAAPQLLNPVPRVIPMTPAGRLPLALRRLQDHNRRGLQYQ